MEKQGDQLTPGVPHISVRRVSFSSSIILLSPKSAIMISASSAEVRKSKFSGLRSRTMKKAVINPADLQIKTLWPLTPMNDPAVMDVLHRLENSAHKESSIAVG